MRPVRSITPNTSRQGSRDRTLSQVVQARRRLDSLPRAGGRAWINGREVGGPDARYGHLAQVHD